jgi:hypothetical protein
MKALRIFFASLVLLFSVYAAAEPRAEALLALDHYLGEWDDTTDPRSKISTKCEWILDGSFLRHSWSLDSGTGEAKAIGMQLMSYDAKAKTYRGWTFFNNGLAQQGEGTWDAASKVFTWISKDAANGLTFVTKANLAQSDVIDVVLITKDRDDNIINTQSRKKVRRK